MKSALLLTALVLAPAPFALGQDTPPPPPKAAPSPAPMPGKSRPKMRHEVHIMERHEGGGPGFGPEFMPPGAWWKNTELAQKIGLSPDQQKRIEDIFLQSRVDLIDKHAALEKQELMLEPLLSANPIDQGKALAQINKIADTRAELEKTNAKMLLGIRAVLSADQWTKLQSMHHMHMRGFGPGGPDGPEMHIRHHMESTDPGPGGE